MKTAIIRILLPFIILCHYQCTQDGGEEEFDVNIDVTSDPIPDYHIDAAPEALPDYGPYDIPSSDSAAEMPAYDSVTWDTAVDVMAESAMPDLPPDLPPDVPPDVQEEEPEPEPDDVCLLDITEPQVHYLSADDSNSQASPIITRSLINNNYIVPEWIIRTYEFLNYYHFDYLPAEQGRVNVSAHMSRVPDDPERFNMQIGVQSNSLTLDEERPMNITFILDTSGSMRGGPIELLKEVCRQIAGNLRSGDVVSMVTWNTERTRTLSSHVVTGPWDSSLMDTIDDLSAGGGTNLSAGLAEGYEVARANYQASWLNRAILISDGQANVGETDEELIAVHADDSEAEGIYLVGVGVGNGYNDTLMDAVTDAGKGAYVFIDSYEEAARIFNDQFLQIFEIAVMDVQVELTLPPVLRMEVFHGEEISGDPKEVEPQHLAPNDAMIFHQTLKMCGHPAVEDFIQARAFFTDPETRSRESETFIVSLPEFIDKTGDAIIKGDAIVAYAEGLKEVYHTLSGYGTEPASELCHQVKQRVRDAAVRLEDDELFEIVDLLDAYCSSLGGRLSTPWY